MYSSRAKCLLMENGPSADSEIIFYSSWKWVFAGNQLTVTEPSGHTSTFPLNSKEPTGLDRENLQEMWLHCRECLAHCEKIETAVEHVNDSPAISTVLPLFPLTVGRRPNSTPSNLTTKLSTASNKENQMVQPILMGLKSFDGSVRSSCSNATSKAQSVRPGDNQRQFSSVTQTVEVPGIGRVMQRSSGYLNIFAL